MQPSLIHLEHALPALADLGLETLVPLLGGRGLQAETIAAALQGLSGGAEKRAARVLVAVARATAKELLAWENDPKAKEEALREAALSSFDEAKQAVVGFFDSLGLSLPGTPDSSEPGSTKGEETAQGSEASAPVP